MKVTADATLPDVLLLEPRVFRDARGSFRELYNVERYEAAGLRARFAQDNLSRSARGVLRGLHLQHPRAQGKLVTVLEGAVFDVAVDVRLGSPTFGRWTGYTLTGEGGQQLWVPPGFAHGFLVLEEGTLFSYKCTDVYSPAHELTVRWDDPAIGIRWPAERPLLSEKDAAAAPLAELADRLPAYDDAAVRAAASAASAAPAAGG
jgi:dTDP-4-dehydrorhamnose 3,5-epimerase